jgi:hypothetical protein
MTPNTINQLIALTIPEIQKIFLQVMQDMVDRAMLDEMIIAIENNDIDALFRASGFTPAVLLPIIERIEQTYRDAAEITVDGWPRRVRTPFGIVQPIFNMRNPIVERDLRTFSSQYITRITNEARENVRQVLEDGMIRGDNPRRTALDIVGRINPTTKKREGGVIGLAPNQMKWVLNSRRYLEQLDNKYFTLSLRDKRFDSVVRKAILNGTPIPQSTISRLVTSYKNRALKYRGEMISRTETIQSINRGENAIHLQMIDEGTLVRQQITKWWDDVGDGVTRTTHRLLGNKYKKDKAIGFDEAFVSPSGARLMYPGDQSLGAPAEEIIACRCRPKYTINWRYNLEE